MFDYTTIENWTQRFDISDSEAERIAARATDESSFVAIWQDSDWWQDSQEGVDQ